MNTAIDALLQIASAPLAPAVHVALGDELRRRAGSLAGELEQMLRARNGWYAFESALHVFPGAASAGQHGLAAWNAGALWVAEYQGLADGCVFFAEDAFGDQFCVKNDKVWLFDVETGGFAEVASSLAGWAARVLAEDRVLTGHPLATEWQARHGALPAGKRLRPRQPFVLGGTFEVDNLYALEDVAGMRFGACIAVQIRDLPDGTEVEIEVAR
jgi:hypothetical protein